MNKEEINYVLESLRFKTSIYRDKKKRNLPFNDDEYYSNILIEYIEELHNKINKVIELIKDKTKIIPLEEGGGLELCDYDIRDLLEILKESEVDEIR